MQGRRLGDGSPRTSAVVLDAEESVLQELIRFAEAERLGTTGDDGDRGFGGLEEAVHALVDSFAVVPDRVVAADHVATSIRAESDKEALVAVFDEGSTSSTSAECRSTWRWKGTGWTCGLGSGWLHSTTSMW